MFKLKEYSKLYEFALALLALLIVLVPRVVLLGGLFFFVVLIIGIVRKHLTFQVNAINSFFVLLYLAYLIGTFYTNNPDLAYKYLEYKLAFLFFPLFFSFVPKVRIDLKLPTIALTAGVVLLSIIGLINSLQIYAELGVKSAFLSGHFSNIHHPTYYSVFALVSMLLIHHGWKKGWSGFTGKWCVPILIYMLVIQILCASLAGLLFMLFYIAYLFLGFILRKLGKRFFVAALILSPILFVFTINYVPGIREQFDVSKQYVYEYVEDPTEFVRSKQRYVGGNETRLIMWTAALMEIMDHPMGVGTGNVDVHLHDRLVELGQPKMAKLGYNPHNQFLQTALEIGIPGLALLLGIVFYSLFIAIRLRSSILLLLSLSLFFNCLFESMLQRQSGVVFYTFWLCLIVMVLLSEKRRSKEVKA